MAFIVYILHDFISLRKQKKSCHSCLFQITIIKQYHILISMLLQINIHLKLVKINPYLSNSNCFFYRHFYPLKNLNQLIFFEKSSFISKQMVQNWQRLCVPIYMSFKMRVSKNGSRMVNFEPGSDLEIYWFILSRSI